MEGPRPLLTALCYKRAMPLLVAASRSGLLDRLRAVRRKRRAELERAALELDIAEGSVGLRAVLKDGLPVLEASGVTELKRRHALV